MMLKTVSLHNYSDFLTTINVLHFGPLKSGG